MPASLLSGSLRTTIRRRTLGAVLLAALALPCAARADAPPAHAVERRYQLRFLRAPEALAVAQNLCPPDGTCEVATVGSNLIAVTAPPDVQERIAGALQAADVPAAAQTFQIILLNASRSGSGVAEELPPAARKAIADVAEFLPYKRFDLLAPVGYVRTNADAELKIASDERYSYDVGLSFRGDARQPGAELLVERFRLRLVPADVVDLALAERAAATAAPRSAAKAGATAHPAATPAAAATPTPPGPVAAESLLDTSFSIRKGETVVVGTSKLHGTDRALVVLLTALP
jgi:hypothetical protein